MKFLFLLVISFFSLQTFAQNPEKLLKEAIPVLELQESELPTFPGYKSSNRGEEIPASEDAVRGYFIRKLNLNAGNFAKRTIVEMQITFVVGVDGVVSVTDMKSPFEAYSKEGARVATEELPKMFPAYRNDKEVAVLYDFPLVFVAKATGFNKTKQLDSLPIKKSSKISSKTKEAKPAANVVPVTE